MLSTTLKEETFVGRNFRGFAVFCPFRGSFIREIFQNGSSAKKVKVAKKKEERTKDIPKFFAPVSISIATSSSNNDNAIVEID